MGNSVNFLEIAKYCKDEFEQKCAKASHMSGYSLLYVAVFEDGQMRISKTPHILSGAHKCYLIHNWSQLAVSCWYDTYDVQSINEFGEVGEGVFDDEYSFSISPASFNVSPRVYLRRNGEPLYSAALWASGISSDAVLTRELNYIWSLYKKCKNECHSMFESQLLCKLAQKEQSIKSLEEKLETATAKELYLQSEVSAYRTLLGDIKSALEK